MTEEGGVAAALRELRAAIGDRVRSEVPLAPFTSLRVGGPAAIFLEAEDDGDLEAAAAVVASNGVPWTAIGKGSNVLVGDGGVPGLVLRLGKGFRWASGQGDRIRAGAAQALPNLANVALGRGLAGMEFGVAIPGSLGGGVVMNAGAHGRSMQDVLESVEVFSMREGRRRTVPASEAGLAYRSSRLPEGSIVVAATVALSVGDAADIRREMDEARSWRRATQPLAEPNCGSVFQNPPGDHAARLVEAVGGKDLAFGGAAVSPKHANFIVTGPGATAADVRAIIAELQRRVSECFGVELQPEVRYVGDFDPAA